MWAFLLVIIHASAAWWLCALRDDYRDCQRLEDESGNDASPNSLKSQIEAYLGEPATRLLLNDKIDGDAIDRNCNSDTSVGETEFLDCKPFV